jgi:C4-dicarboxylate-binding protein DctP
VTDKYNGLSHQINMDARQKVLDSGEEIRQLSPEERQKWVEAMQPVWDEFQEDIGQQLMDAAQAANQSS